MTIGIYRIRNIDLPCKRYVGSSIVSIERVRWPQHLGELLRNRHLNPHLQHAWNLYGAENFVFEIVEDCEGMSLKETQQREQFYLDELFPTGLLYNIRRRTGGGPLSEESIDRMMETLARKKSQK